MENSIFCVVTYVCAIFRSGQTCGMNPYSASSDSESMSERLPLETSFNGKI